MTLIVHLRTWEPIGLFADGGALWDHYTNYYQIAEGACLLEHLKSVVRPSQFDELLKAKIKTPVLGPVFQMCTGSFAISHKVFTQRHGWLNPLQQTSEWRKWHNLFKANFQSCQGTASSMSSEGTHDDLDLTADMESLQAEYAYWRRATTVV